MIGKIRRRMKALLPGQHKVISEFKESKQTSLLTDNIECVIASDKATTPSLQTPHGKTRSSFDNPMTENSLANSHSVKSRSAIERFAYRVFAGRLPQIADYRERYALSGIPVIYEAYMSTSILISLIATVPAFSISFFIEYFIANRPLGLLLIGSLALAAIVFGIALISCVLYPLLKVRSQSTKLESRLTYSFGILGVLSAAGISLDRLFEKIAISESNPALADLARRFLRNVRIFGLDSETALREVADHSPSRLFAKMLQSISVAYKTSGTIEDLVKFESSRLLQEKKDGLRKTVSSLSVLAELYITLVVVGPIIFIVMMSIFGLLPEGGLPDPVTVINVMVFFAIPLFSVMFILLLDSVVTKT